MYKIGFYSKNPQPCVCSILMLLYVFRLWLNTSWSLCKYNFFLEWLSTCSLFNPVCWLSQYLTPVLVKVRDSWFGGFVPHRYSSWKEWVLENKSLRCVSLNLSLLTDLVLVLPLVMYSANGVLGWVLVAGYCHYKKFVGYISSHWEPIGKGLQDLDPTCNSPLSPWWAYKEGNHRQRAVPEIGWQIIHKQ